MRKITGQLLQAEQTLFRVHNQNNKKLEKLMERGETGVRWALGVHNGLFSVCRAPHVETGPLWPMGGQCAHHVTNRRADKSELWTMLFPNLDIDTSRIAIVSAPPSPGPLCLNIFLLFWNQFIESKEAKIDLKLQHQSYCLFMDPSVVQSFLI